jgi:FdrA protein
MVLRSFYQDSVVLMRLARELRSRPGVREVGAVMGTPANHTLLAAAGLATTETTAARADDLILAVAAESDAAAEELLTAARMLLVTRSAGGEQGGTIRPRTLETALRHLPDANVVAISVPGAWAAREAMRALRAGRHVFLFSDHVSVVDEVALKREALARGLLCMGPDCGTAYLGGVGLGFANVVPRGRVGCVAASGTGLQAVVSRLAALGEGVSHGIGVGGRDLSSEVRGAMTLAALDHLAHDPETAGTVLVSKPPADTVLPALETALSRVGKPTVVCCLGAKPRTGAPGQWVDTLDQAADAIVAALRGVPWHPRAFGDPSDVRARLERGHARGTPRGGIVGLYTGGTLAHEARVVLDALLAPGRHRLVDLGDDAYTAGRPHPMIDPEARAERIVAAGSDPDAGVLLIDVVLGRAAHADPAGVAASAVERARHAAGGRHLHVVGSVVGTAADPQGFTAQVGRLETAGIDVLPSNAEAARFAAMLVAPEVAAALLGEPR